MTDEKQRVVHICGTKPTPGAEQRTCADCGRTIYSTNSGLELDSGELSNDINEKFENQIYVCLKCGMNRQRNRGVAG